MTTLIRPVESAGRPLFRFAVGIVLGLKVIPLRWLRKSAAENIFTDLNTALQTGDHARALAMADEAQRKLPTWETAIPSACAYILANRIDQGEAVLRAAINELSSGPEACRETNKDMMGAYFSLLVDVALARRDYEEAERRIGHVLQFPHENYATANTIAEVYLYRGRTEEALTFIDKAVIDYGRAKMPISGFNIALRAWAEGQQGNSTKADKLITQAIKVPIRRIMASSARFIMWGGHMESTLDKDISACQFYRKAIELDEDGLFGHLARVTMDSLE